MIAKIEDDRTALQKITHRWLVIGTDKFMSGWGEARGGLSYAAWACTEDKLRDTECWVEQRKDMLRVRRVFDDGKYKPGSRCAHLHIYVRD